MEFELLQFYAAFGIIKQNIFPFTSNDKERKKKLDLKVSKAIADQRKSEFNTFRGV